MSGRVADKSEGFSRKNSPIEMIHSICTVLYTVVQCKFQRPAAIENAQQRKDKIDSCCLAEACPSWSTVFVQMLKLTGPPCGGMAQ